jgi:virulence-associated protein VagC
MKIAEVFETKEGQAVRLPAEFRLRTDRVAVRRHGECIILEPVKTAEWPAGFFESIAIADPKFTRPNQGSMPPPPSLE